ncbi:MAG: helix-turn-helix transcriptional regulator [Lachnospiraceae bacterium]|nr:helix-turn-helix transcriptional regulator [Lachnospiraceae bacterium]
MNYDVKRTAEIVKTLRKAVDGLTQEKIAEEIGINIKTYQAIEQGARGISIDTLCVVASYFNVSLDYIISGNRATNEWSRMTNGLSEEQNRQLFSIAANMIDTLGWKNVNNR